MTDRSAARLFMKPVFVCFCSAVLATGCAHASGPRADGARKVQPEVPILLYHHVDDLHAGAGRARRRWTISPEKFEAQMGLIARHGFHPVTMEQLSAHLERGKPLPYKPVVISFDDGWKDQYDKAVPILKKYGFPATFFVITDSVGHSDYMSWEQLRELSDSGRDIQPHSRTHARLSVLPLEQAQREIVDSKRAIEERLHKTVSVFGYPFGSYSDEVISLVRDAGFDTAVTVNGLNGGYLFRADRSYVLPRYAVEGDDETAVVSRYLRKEEPVFQALFVSLVQKPVIFSSRARIDELIRFAVQAGVNTLFVQVYRENRAWFPSETADSSEFKQCRDDLGEDPLALLIGRAHAQGIQVHAWLNLLSLSRNQDAQFLRKYGTDVLTGNLSEKKTLRDYLIDEQYFLEPGDPRVREDLSRIVGELLVSYPQLDGIQFDYIRYPDAEPRAGYARSNMDRFKKAAGVSVIKEESPAWKEWKRGQVTELLTILAAAARSLRPGLQVSATGCMPYSRSYHEAFQDWPSWVNNGVVDFVTLMNYSPDPGQFEGWMAAVKEKIADPSNIKTGVGVYKLAKRPAALERELRCVAASGTSGALFHYGSLLENPELRLIVIAGGTRGVSMNRE